MQILGKTVALRAIEENDLISLHRWANDAEIQDMMGNPHFPSSMDFHKNWFNSLKTDHLNQRFAVDDQETGIIGLSSLISIDWRNKHAWHGLMLGETKTRGKGFGVDSVMTTMRYAFDELGLERLDGSIIEYNKISYSFYCDKLGWQVEGKRRNYYFRKGKYWDQIVVGITKDDYYRLLDKTKYWEA